jgi:hypothetical protein
VQVSRGLAGVLAAAFLYGCTSKETTQAPPGEAVATLPASASDSGTAFSTFMDSLQWGRTKTVYMCPDTGTCSESMVGRVRVDLAVTQNSYLVDPRAVAPGGQLLVRAVNRGSHPTRSYHFRPGYVYSLVAYPDSRGDTTSHWVLKETDTTTHLTITVPNVQGPYHPCLEHPPAMTDDVDLSNCGDKHVAPAINKSGIGAFAWIDRFFAPAQVTDAVDKPIWKSCPSGCCTLPQAQQVQ